MGVQGNTGAVDPELFMASFGGWILRIRPASGNGNIRGFGLPGWGGRCDRTDLHMAKVQGLPEGQPYTNKQVEKCRSALTERHYRFPGLFKR